MENIKLMNMCKIINKENSKILVQERIKDWQGIAFPGGKIELGESIIPSVKREIFEETGLILKAVEICGIKDWYDKTKNERHLIFLFIATDYEGELISKTDEGRVYWINENEIKKEKLADDFDKLLEIFNNKHLNELVYVENSKNNFEWELNIY